MSGRDIAGSGQWAGGITSSLTDLGGIGLGDLRSSDDQELAEMVRWVVARIAQPGTHYGGREPNDPGAMGRSCATAGES